MDVVAAAWCRPAGRGGAAFLGAFLVLVWAGGVPLAAQTAPSTGLEVGALPALNYDADEGFGYGVLAELYHYGDGTGAGPYAWTLQPRVFLTTEGRRDFTVFFDSPRLLSGGWRIDAFAGLEEQIATPYYGLGNAAPFDEALDDGADPYFYRYGRERRGVLVNVQRSLWGSPLRALVGVGVADVAVDLVPEDEGTTLLAQELGGNDPSGWTSQLRAGLIWDTRDRETGPRSGSWTELLVARADTALGGDFSYTRWTLTDRRYVSLSPTLVLAHRWLLQGTSEGAPVHDLQVVQTSFKQQEGLGGAKTVRGILKNRYLGRGMLVWNAELRWRAAERRLFGRTFHTVLSGYLDSGRVWTGQPRLGELLSDLHHGYGGGVRVGMGENFTAAVDAGTSAETGLQLYIGLGYLY